MTNQQWTFMLTIWLSVVVVPRLSTAQPVLHTDGIVPLGTSTYINCSVPSATTASYFMRPDNITVISCENSSKCKRNMAGYFHEEYLGNASLIVFPVFSVSVGDNGTWRCTHGPEVAENTLTVTVSVKKGNCTVCPKTKFNNLQSDGSDHDFVVILFVIVICMVLIFLVIVFIFKCRNKTNSPQNRSTMPLFPILNI